MRNLAAIFIVSIVFLSCENAAGPQAKADNPLIGTWQWEDEANVYTLRFSDTEFYWCTEFPGNRSRILEGIYTYTDTIIFFEIIQPVSESGYSHAAYKVYGDKLYCRGGIVDVSRQGFLKQ